MFLIKTEFFAKRVQILPARSDTMDENKLAVVVGGFFN
ncbi:hypothetical protein LYNGBM3L_51360 [Moorena producens 3L]|uniref:Uncharacterized protein n=1 Tax=Moorena producens 3L TaxID=489825 RepID=F4XYK0_9CYAN|nr:hypothetical protein LYNGBM3L_51360 [Moorena producens 3L]